MPAKVIELRTCTMDAKGSRTSVHYAKPDQDDLEPVCGSRNDNKRNFKPGGGMHVDCTKCKTWLSRMRVAIDNGDDRAAAVAAGKPVKRKAMPVGSRPVPKSKAKAVPAPEPKAKAAPVPEQRRNGVPTPVSVFGPVGRPMFQAPVFVDLPPRPEPVPPIAMPSPANPPASTKETAVTAVVEPTAVPVSSPAPAAAPAAPPVAAGSNSVTFDLSDMFLAQETSKTYVFVFGFGEKELDEIVVEAADPKAAFVLAIQKMTFTMHERHEQTWMGRAQ